MINLEKEVAQSDNESVVKKQNKKRNTGPPKVSNKSKLINIDDEPESNNNDLPDHPNSFNNLKRKSASFKKSVKRTKVQTEDVPAEGLIEDVLTTPNNQQQPSSPLQSHNHHQQHQLQKIY